MKGNSGRYSVFFAAIFVVVSAVAASTTVSSPRADAEGELGVGSAVEVSDTVERAEWRMKGRVKGLTTRNPSDPDTLSGDLRDPENISTGAFYNEHMQQYLFGTKLGEDFLEAPYLMSQEEYNDYAMKRSLRAYYRNKNAMEYASGGKNEFDFSDMHFSLGKAEKIFGPGGVQIKTQGSAKLTIGANMRNIDNPSLSERNRKTFGFDFEEEINVSVQASVGDKLSAGLNFNSESTFDYDQDNMKLGYEGKEDEIIKLIEAGNITMPTNNSLVQGASSLFGIRTDLQFGRLKLQTVASQKKSNSVTVNTNGDKQLYDFELKSSDYEANRHFFLAHYFRDAYTSNMSQLPNVLSGISISRIEIWVTNKTGTTTNTRDIIAFTDLGEQTHISNATWSMGTTAVPANASNTLYATISGSYSDARDITQTKTILEGLGLTGGTDFEKIQSARLLSSSEYTLNTSIGYISLKSTLTTDQVVAVAYEYTYQGTTYQVGEFASDITDTDQALIVKSLKNTSNRPSQGNWDLMMKNVYSLGATNVQSTSFKLQVKILSDTTGVYLNYLPETTLKDKTLLQLLGLDRLDNNNNANSNGYFDFVSGYTIDTSTGRVYFPSPEPFGEYLEDIIGSVTIADNYTYYELYDSTKTKAQQISEKDKFIITGQYMATKTGEISIGSTNITRGSVTVTAGGVTLTEGSDYTVDYYSGIVTIINQSILDAGTSISVDVESDASYGLQRKTMLGLNWDYAFSDELQFGGTVMHLQEQALTTKTSMGNEPLNNTMWGLSLSWKKESQWLTNLINRIPWINARTASSIDFQAEFANLIAGKVKGSQGNSSYIDDFESSKSEIDISAPRDWMLSSVPASFAESGYSNDVRYGYNRALMAWYNIDRIFTNRSSSLTPSHIKNDLEQLSDPDVREVYVRELFPNRQSTYTSSTTLDVLNVAFYPYERGPYNLDTNIDEDGHLNNRSGRWGGMMRKIDTSDFETANVGYIEFWLMDPFIKARENGTNLTGDLYFNLGEISEDVLKDGYKFYESGMPVDGDESACAETVWGRAPVSSGTVTYAFNTASGARALQDIGFNGLSSEDERTYGAYADYLSTVRSIVRGEVYDSIYNSPSADLYHYYRGTDYDTEQRSILDRYKYINNPNGNSVETSASPESYATAYKTTPDLEDINQDYTLNEYDEYFEYHVRIDPDYFAVGENFIADSRTATVQTRNGETQEVTWYLFRIPVEDYESVEGSISDYSSIRFMRMYLTGFEEPVVLRFATLNLVRSDWRAYEQALYSGEAPAVTGQLTVSSVSYEENSDKSPVNYVLPPGISRIVDGSSLIQSDEATLALNIDNLGSSDARAAYKRVNLDLRGYEHIQMFAHANAPDNDATLQDNDMSLFIRIGSDYKSNFYEYEIPLAVTPEGTYASSTAGRLEVWPEENMLDIDLSLLTGVKSNRNAMKSLGTASYTTLYSEYDPDKPANKVSVMGNPSLGEVKVIMIGVRNNSASTQSIEVWANELRLQGYENSGGWAAKGALNIQLSDIATLSLSGQYESYGFGGIEETLANRRDDDWYTYSITTNIQLGKLVPESVKLNAPFYYSYTKERSMPHYNPLDSDITLEDALDALSTQAEKDSLKNITTTTIVSKNFSLSGVRFALNILPRTALPIDPTNFSFTFSSSSTYTTGETTAWERNISKKLSLAYSYSPGAPKWQPGKSIKSKNKWLTLFKEQSFNWLPQTIGFNSDITWNYYELQERDLDETDNELPLTWSSDLLWNRSFSLRWDLTDNLHMSFSSGTNAEIEQPYTAVNKELYPDRYAAWKDSIWDGLMAFGDPLSYSQTFEASWKVPLNKLPVFDWLTATGTYKGYYTWTRGTELDDGTSLGHTITSKRDVSATGKLNLETLYNHSNFLKKTNRRFSSTRSSTATRRSSAKNSDEEEKRFEQEVQLQRDTTVNVNHNLKTRKVRVNAILPDGKRYAIRYKVVNGNTITITSQDTVAVKLTVRPARNVEEQKWYKILQCVARGLMMARSVNISYTNSYSLSLPGFLPTIGDFFGQARSNGALQPGLDFAFGFIGESYIQKAADNGWLLMSDSVTTAATSSSNENLSITATLEPFRDFKIDLNATRSVNKAKSIQFMYDGMPTTVTGSFSQTTISLGTAFQGAGNANNGYANKAFDKFCSLLDSYQARVEALYEGAEYPASSPLAGETFDPENGTIDKYAAEVMIPAFLEAYTGSSSLDMFPSFSRLLPNWSVTYNGLQKLPRMKKIFKSFTLSHAYKSAYTVGSYSSYSTFVEYMGDYGFVTSATTGNPVPSSIYDISTVAISESFSPLIGLSATFANDLTASLSMAKTRTLTLSMTSIQITETRATDFTLGLGYKVADFKLFSSGRAVQRKTKRSTSGNDEDESSSSSSKSTSSSDFAHTLNLRFDFTYRNQATINRDIATESSEATSGSKTFNFSFSAEYALSKMLSLTAYYERQTSNPLLTSSSYPTTTQDFGLAIKFSLTH